VGTGRDTLVGHGAWHTNGHGAFKTASFKLLHHTPHSPDSQWFLFVSETEGIRERTEICWRWGCYPHCKWLDGGPRSRLVPQWNQHLKWWSYQVVRNFNDSLNCFDAIRDHDRQGWTLCNSIYCTMQGKNQIFSSSFKRKLIFIKKIQTRRRWFSSPFAPLPLAQANKVKYILSFSLK